MAIEYGWTGFEWGETDFSPIGVLRGALVGATTLLPRSGEYMYSAFCGDANPNVFLNYARKNTAIGNPVGAGNTAKCYTRVFFRINTAPSVNDCGVLGSGGISSTPVTWGALTLNSDRTFQCATFTSPLGGVVSTAVLSLGVWYRADLIATVGQAGANATSSVTCSVYTEAGTLVETVTDSSTPTPATSGLPTAAQIANGMNQSARYDIDFDDWWIAWGDGADVAGMAFPTATRIARFSPTAQGASAAWTGDYRTVIDTPYQTATTDEQSSSGAGQQTTFTHATAASQGVTGIEGVIVRTHMKAGSAGNESLLLGGVAYTVPVPTTYFTPTTGQVAVNYAAIADATFDGWEFGARNDRGTSLQLAAICMEVLHNGPGVSAPYVEVTEPFRLNIIQHTGNGTYKTMTGMGFPAQILMFFPFSGSALATSCVYMVRTGGTRMLSLAGPSQETHNGVLSITPDGCTLGPNNNVNQNTIVYVVIGIRDGGAGGGFYMTHRTRCGQSSSLDNFDIPFRDGFAPSWGVDNTSVSASPVFRTTAMVGDVSISWAGGPSLADQIQAFTASGFQVGTLNQVSVNTLHQAMIMRIGTALSGILHVGTMTPSGSTATITGIPFTPVWITVQKSGSGSGAFWRAVGAQTGTNSTGWGGGFPQGNGITAMTADGCTIGSNLAQNGVPVYWVALASGALSAGGCLVDLATSAGGVGGAGCQVSLPG